MVVVQPLGSKTRSQQKLTTSFLQGPLLAAQSHSSIGEWAACHAVEICVSGQTCLQVFIVLLACWKNRNLVLYCWHSRPQKLAPVRVQFSLSVTNKEILVNAAAIQIKWENIIEVFVCFFKVLLTEFMADLSRQGAPFQLTQELRLLSCGLPMPKSPQNLLA